jgi:hypothetical protein
LSSRIGRQVTAEIHTTGVSSAVSSRTPLAAGWN